MTIKSLTRSTIENNVFYRSMLAGNEAYSPGAEFLLEEVVLASSQASVTFDVSSYAGVYQHLQIRGTVRDAGGSQARLAIQMNDDTSSNYSYHSLFGRGSSVQSTSGSNASYGWVVNDTPYSGQTANSFAGFVIDILDPFETTKNTTTKSLGGFSPSGGSDVLQSIGLVSNVWRNTDAVTSIKLITISGTAHAIGSRFSIYGAK